jgi:hypothetical protein
MGLLKAGDYAPRPAPILRPKAESKAMQALKIRQKTTEMNTKQTNSTN